MEELKAKGTIHHIGEVKKVSDKMTIQEFVLSIGDTYPQLVQFQAINERVKFLNDAKKAQQCEVKFDLRGREYNGKYYVSLNAWDIRLSGAEQSKQTPVSDAIDDDLPF